MPDSLPKETRRPLLIRPRNWFAERMWNLAHALYVDEDAFLPKCPDCGIAPDYGPDSECDVCIVGQERQHIVERLCVGMGSRAQMMVKAREVVRAPVLGVGIALTTDEYPMEIEPCGESWRLMVWIDRDADYGEHRRLKNLSA